MCAEHDLTTRDRVWSAALAQTMEWTWFQVSDVMARMDDVDESQRRTVQRTLRAMIDTGWIEKRSAGSPYYRAGRRLRMASREKVLFND